MIDKDRMKMKYCVDSQEETEVMLHNEDKICGNSS